MSALNLSGIKQMPGPGTRCVSRALVCYGIGRVEAMTCLH